MTVQNVQPDFEKECLDSCAGRNADNHQGGGAATQCHWAPLLHPMTVTAVTHYH